MKRKSKAGKSRKAAARKHVARKVARRQAPAAQVQVDQYAQACKAGKPVVAMVAKAGDRMPVQLRDAAHLAQLRGEHGEANVEVQS